MRSVPRAMRIACRSAALAVEREVELEHVHPGLAEETERAAVGVRVDEREDVVQGKPASARDAWRLQAGVRDGDLRIESRARGCHGIDRDMLAGAEIVLAAVGGGPPAD